MKPCFAVPFLLFAFTFASLAQAKPVARMDLSTLNLRQLLELQDELALALAEKKITTPNSDLIAVNKALVEKSRQTLLAQGYELGEVVAVPGRPHHFRLSILKAPAGSAMERTIDDIYRRFGVRVQMEVNGIPRARAFYNHTDRAIRLRPAFALLPMDKVSSTLLHEVHHGFLHQKRNLGIAHPLNAQILSDPAATRDLTTIEPYPRYLHYQELSTHEKDFYLTRSGFPSLFELEGMRPEEVVIMKGERAMEIGRAILKYNKIAADFLEEAKGFGEAKLIRGADVQVLQIPFFDEDKKKYGVLEMDLPGVTPETAFEDVKKMALQLLDEGITKAKSVSRRLGPELAAFRKDTRIGPRWKLNQDCPTAFAAVN